MDKKAGIGLGMVIIILFSAVLLFQGIKFSTTSITNNSNTYTTSEGVFHQWTIAWNVTMDSGQVIGITPAAVITILGSNTTYRNILDGSRLFFYTTLQYLGPSPAPTSSINGVYNVYVNGTAQAPPQVVVVGQDGSILQRTTVAVTPHSGVAASINFIAISPNGLYIVATTTLTIGANPTTYRMILLKGS
jgi:hypothetical protein